MGTKIPTCFNAEVGQFFTMATPNSRRSDNMVQNLVPIFHCPHVPVLFNNLRFHTDGIQLPLSS